MRTPAPRLSCLALVSSLALAACSEGAATPACEAELPAPRLTTCFLNFGDPAAPVVGEVAAILPATTRPAACVRGTMLDGHVDFEGAEALEIGTDAGEGAVVISRVPGAFGGLAMGDRVEVIWSRTLEDGGPGSGSIEVRREGGELELWVADAATPSDLEAAPIDIALGSPRCAEEQADGAWTLLHHHLATSATGRSTDIDPLAGLPLEAGLTVYGRAELAEGMPPPDTVLTRAVAAAVRR